ncbi:MAG: DUF973 family protein [Thermoplasmata archaeon]|nr:DUF973 family protein [Thermoplasmata archaeon]
MPRSVGATSAPATPPGTYPGPPAPPGYGYYAPPPPGAYYYPSPPRPSVATRDVDRSALGYSLAAALMVLISGVVGFVTLFGVFGAFSIAAPNGAASIFGGVFLLALIVSGTFSVVQVALLRTAFYRLSAVDQRFATPSKLTLALLVGFVMLFVGLYPLLVGAQATASCIATGTPAAPANCGFNREALIGLFLVGVGGVIALIGYIGMVVGIWRLGTRYENDLFKVGAILLILPLLSFVGAILLLVASHSEREKLGSYPAPGTPSF